MLKELGDLLLSPANKAVWLSYGQNGERRMTVVVEARPEQGYMRLQHPSRASDRAEHMDYTVGLTSTAAGFGGRRWWFSCPVSKRRCAVLYLPRGARRFGSAKGYGLAYSVTRMEEQDRLWHRMAKIARRLGDRDPDPEIRHAGRNGCTPPPTTDCSKAGTMRPSGGRRFTTTKIAGCIVRLNRLGR